MGDIDQRILLIDRLLKKSAKRELDWDTSTHDIYVVQVKSGRIFLGETDGEFDSKDYYLRIENFAGDVIEYFRDTAFQPDSIPEGYLDGSTSVYEAMGRLYKMAGLKVTGGDLIMKEILEALDGDDF